MFGAALSAKFPALDEASVEYIVTCLDDPDASADLESFTDIVEPFLTDIGVEDATKACSDLFAECQTVKKRTSTETKVEDGDAGDPHPRGAVLLTAPVCLGAGDSGTAAITSMAIHSKINDAAQAQHKNKPILNTDSKKKSPKDKRKSKQPAPDNTAAGTAESRAIQNEITERGVDEVDDMDDYGSAWHEAKETGAAWGRRGFGGRGIRKGYAERGRDVKVYNVTLSYKGTELLKESTLTLMHGHIYGMLGNNGCGKSTLLRRIGSGLLPGFNRNLQTVYIDQELDGDTVSPLETLLQSGDAGEDPSSFSAERQSELEAILVDEEASDADRDAAAEALASMPADDVENMATGGDKGADSSTSANERAAVKALQMCGFSAASMRLPTKDLSGGWRMRAALAKAVYLKPDVLLLDEPTNHLDIQAVAWLEGCILDLVRTTQCTVLIVSHDRAFLGAVVTDIIEFTDKQLVPWGMDFYTYVDAKEKKAQAWINKASALDRKREALDKSIKQLEKASAGKRGDEKKSAQVASRKKKMERFGADKTEDGTKWKRSTMGERKFSVKDEMRNCRGRDAGMRLLMQQKGGEKPLEISFDDPIDLTDGADAAKPLVQLSDVTFRYDPTAPSPIVLENVDLSISMGSRLAILGANGQGKSTLLRLILGELSATSGTIVHRRTARIAHFSQHSSDALPPQRTPLEHMLDVFSGEPEAELRKVLGSYHIRGSLINKQIGALSGGQKARVVLAIVSHQAPHILLLDEPTNHLDMHSISSLCDALETYKGAVVLVSHNRDLVEALGPNAELWEVKDQCVTFFNDSIDAFKSAARGQRAGGEDLRSLYVPLALQCYVFSFCRSPVSVMPPKVPTTASLHTVRKYCNFLCTQMCAVLWSDTRK
eukprot:m.1079616 g.1079616  ORF g.1079616 m.1079616 type:complete len:887 (-) comp24254_c0_seq78:2660-5320(-)